MTARVVDDGDPAMMTMTNNVESGSDTRELRRCR